MARTKPQATQAFLPPQFEMDATVNGVQGQLLVQMNGDRTLLDPTERIKFLSHALSSRARPD